MLQGAMMGMMGLGLVIGIRDMFSRKAAGISAAAAGMDKSMGLAAIGMQKSMALMKGGMGMMLAGGVIAGIPLMMLKSTAQTQKAIGELSSLGVKDLNAIADAAADFTDKWAGYQKHEIIGAAYDIKSALAHLSDEAVGEFAKIAALTAKAGKASMEEMKEAFTSGYGIYKPMMPDMDDIKWAEQYSGALAQTIKQFKTTGSRMSAALVNLGASAAASKVPLEEQLAVLGALQTTMSGKRAGVLYMRYMSSLIKAQEKLGIDLTDPVTGRWKGIIEVMDEIRKKFPDLSLASAQAQLKEGFGSIRAVKFVQLMEQETRTLQPKIDKIREAMLGGTGLTTEMAEAMNEDIKQLGALIKQTWQNMTEELGVHLTPWVAPLLKGIASVFRKIRKTAQQFPGLTKAIMGTMFGFGSLLFIVGLAVTVFGLFGMIISAIPAALMGIASSVLFVLPAIGIIAALVGGVMTLRKAWTHDLGGLRSTVTKWTEQVKAVIGGLRVMIQNMQGDVTYILKRHKAILEDMGVWDFTVKAAILWHRLKKAAVGAVEGIKLGIGAMLPKIEGAVKGLGKTLENMFGIQMDHLGTGTGWQAWGEKVGAVIGYVMGGMVYLAIVIVTRLIPAAEKLLDLMFNLQRLKALGDWRNHAGVALKLAGQARLPIPMTGVEVGMPWGKAMYNKGVDMRLGAFDRAYNDPTRQRFRTAAPTFGPGSSGAMPTASSMTQMMELLGDKITDSLKGQNHKTVVKLNEKVFVEAISRVNQKSNIRAGGTK